MKARILAIGLVLGLAAGGQALAQAKPEVLVKQRQSAMTLIGKYFGPLGAMAQGRVPFNAQVVARNAGYLEVLAQLPWDGFAAATSGVKSDALPAVFSDPAKFQAGAERLQKAVSQLHAAASSGNEGNIKAAIGEVGKTCGGCHDNFREKH